MTSHSRRQEETHVKITNNNIIREEYQKYKKK
jgi:hypothetical protein